MEPATSSPSTSASARSSRGGPRSSCGSWRSRTRASTWRCIARSGSPRAPTWPCTTPRRRCWRGWRRRRRRSSRGCAATTCARSATRRGRATRRSSRRSATSSSRGEWRAASRPWSSSGGSFRSRSPGRAADNSRGDLMPITADSFELFRRKQQLRQLEEKLQSRAAETREEIVRRIVEADEQEEVEKKIGEQMRDFFRDSTRIAAAVFSTLPQKRTDEIEMRPEREVAGFLHDTKPAALQVLSQLKQGSTTAPKALDSLLQDRARRLARVAATGN